MVMSSDQQESARLNHLAEGSALSSGNTSILKRQATEFLYIHIYNVYHTANIK